ncbi:glycosyltransferase [Niabella terrae]
MSKTIYFTVTTDLVYDQRMRRICGSLSQAGYQVHLVGRKKKSSPPPSSAGYVQYQLPCWFEKGKLFYIEYQIRLFCFLLFKKMDAICAIDLDTILPVLSISRIKRIPRVYDAHELFSEMKEIKSRPLVYRIWKALERYALPRFPNGYTVCDSIARIFKEQYGVDYATVRNLPLPLVRPFPADRERKPVFIYTGAVNEGRGFESLIPAMRQVDSQLIVCGDGNFMQQAQQLAREYGVSDRVQFLGMLSPAALREQMQQASIGINLIDACGLNQYYSLANKFFDYIQAGLPQITMNYPEYRAVNEIYQVALLINNLEINELAGEMNNLLQDIVVYQNLKKNCKTAAAVLTWQQEETILLEFYKKLFNNSL